MDLRGFAGVWGALVFADIKLKTARIVRLAAVRSEFLLHRLTRRILAIAYALVIAGCGLAAFWNVELELQKQTFDVARYWPQLLIPLGTLIAFSGLMYNRARAIGTDARKYRFKSLYAAERLMAAACHYSVALVLLFFVVSTWDFWVALFKVAPDKVWTFKLNLLLPAFMFGGWAATELFLSLRLVAPSPMGRRTIKVARRVARML